MLSLTREINPALPAGLEEKLRRWAVATFETVGGTGAPRVDFYCNEATGETWLNEVNPCPGSFGYFLWEAAEPPIGFTQLLSMLIDEALTRHRECQLPDDPVPAGSAPAAAVVACTRFINALERDFATGFARGRGKTRDGRWVMRCVWRPWRSRAGKSAGARGLSETIRF